MIISCNISLQQVPEGIDHMRWLALFGHLFYPTVILQIHVKQLCLKVLNNIFVKKYYTVKMRRKKIQIFIIISNFKTLKFFDDVLVLLYIPKKVDFKNKKNN